MLNTNIILIGPMGAGKTTQQKLLAEALNLTPLELDSLRWGYYNEIGYDKEKARQLEQEGGGSALLHYWKPFEVHAVERVFEDHPSGCVISFGAGHSVHDDPAHFERVRMALDPYPYVILLLPSADVDESVRVMTERLLAEFPQESKESVQWANDTNRAFIENPSNARLAKFTVYTKDKTPAETCAEIIEQLKLHSGE